METSSDGIALIKHFESLGDGDKAKPGLQPYICPAGHWTIGWGHLIRRGEVFDTITEEEADALLANDLKDAEAIILRLVHVPLTQCQFDALVSIAFNVPFNALRTSTLIRLLNKEDYLGACAEFARWHYANKRRVKGLLRRRIAEAALYLSD